MDITTKIILGYYLIINLFLFVTMGYDKTRAKKDAWRVPESTLFIIALLGGAVGGFLGMFLFHHKKNKPQFYIIYALALILHAVFLYFIFTSLIVKK